MERDFLTVLLVDKGQFVNVRKKFIKSMAINSLCNNSIKSCDVLSAANSSKMQQGINVKIASIRVTRNVMAKWLQNVLAKRMLKRYLHILVSHTYRCTIVY